MKKRILSLLLTVAMLLTVTPLTAFAEDCIHEYSTLCDAECDRCGAIRVPEHNPSSSSCDRYCIQCFEPLGTIDDHVLGEDGHTCTVCGHILSCADGYHWYYNDCDKTCHQCGEETRPEADHQRNDRPACSESAECVLCGIDFPPTIPHTDNGIGTCAVCNENMYRCEYGYHTTDSQCDAECNLCGAAVEPHHVSSNWACKNYCVLCEAPLGNTADHDYECQIAIDPTCVKAGYYSYQCTVCDEFYEETPPAGEHDYACYQEEEPTCTKDGALYYQCTQCGDSYVEPLPATGWHAYEYECSGNCLYCGQVNPNPGDHSSNAEYPCQDGECILCGDFAPAGDHLADGLPCAQYCAWCYEDLPAIADHEYVNHIAEAPTCNQEGYYYYSCLACGDVYEEYPPATGDHVYDNATDPDCNLCGEPREGLDPDLCLHRYEYDCSTTCYLCGFNTRPEAACLPDDGWLSGADATHHNFDYFCQYCGNYMSDLREEHYDDNGDGACDVCGNESCEEHVYDSNFDWFCNVCYEYREVDIPLDLVGTSISEDVNGLAMAFSAKVEGIAFNGTRIIYDNATIGGHKLIGLGAVVSNNYEEMGYAPTLEDVDGIRVIDVPAVYAYDYDEATGTLYFAIRIINIPDEYKDRMLVFTPYFIFENNAGEQEAHQSSGWGDAYNWVADASL